MDMVELRAQHTEHGGTFFQAGAMQFFGSVVESEPIEGTGGIYFLTSEDPGFRTDDRKYTVRRYYPEGRWAKRIDTVGAFHCFDSKSAALKAAKEYASGKQHPSGCMCFRCQEQREEI